MPSVPRAPIPSVGRAAAPGAPRSAEAASAGSRALGAVAQGLSDVGRTGTAFAIKSAQVRNAKQVADARLTMDLAGKELQSQLENNADFETWEQSAQDAINGASAAIYEADDGHELAPVVKRQLDEEFEKWSATTSTVVANQRVRAENQQSDQALAALADLSYMKGDYEEADAITSERVAMNMLTETQATFQRQLGRQKAERANAQEIIDIDPFALQDAIDNGAFPNLTSQEIASLKRTARTEQNRVRAETMEDLWEQSDAGNFITQDALDGLIDAGHIKRTQAKDFMGAQTRMGLDPDANIGFALALDAAAKYKPAEDPVGEDYANIMGSMAGLPAEWRDQVKKQLNARKSGITQKTDLGMKHLNLIYSQDILGDRDIEPLLASEVYTQAATDFLNWAKDHPDADGPAQVKFINDMPAVKEAISDPLVILGGDAI